MPGLARKILVFAAVDGLVIQPLASKGQKPFTPAALARKVRQVLDMGEKLRHAGG